MTAPERLRWWLAGAAVAALLLWLLRGSLGPFLAGAAIAYLLDPVVDRMESLEIKRTIASLLAVVTSFVLAVAAFLLVFPVLLAQASGLLDLLPDIVSSLQSLAAKAAESGIGGAFGGSLADGLLDALRSAGPTVGVGTLKAALAGGVAVVDAVAFAVITPVVGFYLLVDWKRLIKHVDNLVPRSLIGEFRLIAACIDRTLAAFARGQLSVCAVLGVFYAVTLSLVGLDYAVAIGITAGIASFIPYVGTIIGFGLATLVAVVQYFPEPLPILVVIGIFTLGQLAESYVLAPRLVGRGVGLHPIWLLFALVAGGNLFGFAGVLVAVPVAAALGVLVRYFERRYRDGRFYRYDGGSGEQPEEDLAAGTPTSLVTDTQSDRR